MERGVYEAHAFVLQHIAVDRVSKLSFVIRMDVFEKASRLLPTLIRNIGNPTNVEIAASKVNRRTMDQANETAEVQTLIEFNSKKLSS